MGAGNVAIVLARWSRSLNDKPFRVLVAMALTAKDDDTTPRYWGGWAHLARAAGATFPDACERCRGCSDCQAAQRTARRAISALTEAGIVTLVGRARKAWNAEYELHIGEPNDGPSVHRYGSGPKERRTLSVLQTPDAERPADAGRSASTLPDAQRPAVTGRVGGHTGIPPGTTSPEVSKSPAPVDNRAAPAAGQIPPMTATPRAAARPGPRQQAIWPTSAPDPPQGADTLTRAGPGELRARIAATRPRTQALRGAS